MRVEADAIVVGAGPAGSAAAASLARAGLTAIVLAGGSPLGWIETVPASIASLLPELGLPHAALRSVGAHCHWHGAGHPALHIDRTEFDLLLRHAACHAGARLCRSRAAGVIHESDRIVGVRTRCGQTLRARMVVDASGSRTWLGRQLALRAQVLSPALIAWRGEADGIPEDMEDGAVRFQPRSDGWLFLATWRGRTTWTAIGRGRRRPDMTPLVALQRQAASNVHWCLTRPVAGRGWLLAGEAAGRLDPAWGQGLVTAVVSGIAAGRTAAACLADPARESVYLAAYDGWFADRIHAAAATLRKRYTDNRINLAATGEGQQ